MVKVRVWALSLNRHEACLPPLLTVSIEPNEALIGGVGCCSLEKAQGQQSTMKMTTKTGVALFRLSGSVNCMLSNHFKSMVAENSPSFNSEHLKGPLNTFVCRLFFTWRND